MVKGSTEIHKVPSTVVIPDSDTSDALEVIIGEGDGARPSHEVPIRLLLPHPIT